MVEEPQKLWMLQMAISLVAVTISPIVRSVTFSMQLNF